MFIYNRNIQEAITALELNFTINDLVKFTQKSKFIDTYLYNISNEKLDVEDFFILYQDCIDICIKSSNWKCMKCLWEGYSYHDRSFPCFNRDLFTASEHSSFETFLLTFYGYYCLSFDYDEEYEWADLRKLLDKNPNTEVLELINKYKLEDFAKNHKHDNDCGGVNILDKQRKKYLISIFEELGIWEEYQNTHRENPLDV